MREDTVVRILVVIIVIALVGSCGTDGVDIDDSGGIVVIDRVDLPRPVRSGGAPLTDALSDRRSVRAYTAEPVNLTEVSQLL